jgi:hypothetical protein
MRRIGCIVSAAAFVPLLLTACLTSDGSRTLHRTTRAIVGVIDDTHVLYSESRVDDPCDAACLAGRGGRRREALYVLNVPNVLGVRDAATASPASTATSVLIVEDSLPIAARFIHPYLYLDTPDPDSVVRVDPVRMERRAFARPFGLFRSTIVEAFPSSEGKYTVVYGCSLTECSTALYEAATGVLFQTLPVAERPLAFADDSLVLYGRNVAHSAADSNRFAMFEYHAATGFGEGALIAGRILGTVRLFNGSGFLLYRNGGPARMVPELGDRAFRDRLELLAALDAFPFLAINPVTGAYFQERNGNLAGGNFYTGLSALLMDLAVIE